MRLRLRSSMNLVPGVIELPGGGSCVCVCGWLTRLISPAVDLDSIRLPLQYAAPTCQHVLFLSLGGFQWISRRGRRGVTGGYRCRHLLLLLHHQTLAVTALELLASLALGQQFGKRRGTVNLEWQGKIHNLNLISIYFLVPRVCDDQHMTARPVYKPIRARPGAGNHTRYVSHRSLYESYHSKLLGGTNISRTCGRTCSAHDPTAIMMDFLGMVTSSTRFNLMWRSLWKCSQDLAATSWPSNRTSQKEDRDQGDL